jgi:hypothetical protein
MLAQRSNPKTTTSSSQECRQCTRTRQQLRRAKNQQQARPEPAQGQCQRMLLRQLHRKQLQQQGSSRCKRTPERFCERRMVLSGDPFSHTYGGSSELNAADFLTSFYRKSFGIRIVAKINTNLNKPTISADRSWAYLNFGTLHKHCFLYDTGASVTLITLQTFEHSRQNSKLGNK